MRLGDVASISSGLVSVFEKPLEKVDNKPEQTAELQQEEEMDDNISTR
jgi:hypothetical protein